MAILCSNAAHISTNVPTPCHTEGFTSSLKIDLFLRGYSISDQFAYSSDSFINDIHFSPVIEYAAWSCVGIFSSYLITYDYGSL